LLTCNLSTLLRILRKDDLAAKVKHLIDSKNKQVKKDVFCDDYKKDIDKKTFSKQTVPGDK